MASIGLVLMGLGGAMIYVALTNGSLFLPVTPSTAKPATTPSVTNTPWSGHN